MPLYEQIAGALRARVDTGEWPRGKLIPREIDLCAQYGVSRSTIRMAMTRLVDGGLFERVRGVGTFVAGVKTLQKNTLFIDSFALELESRGLRPRTELLSFCVVPPDARINERLRLPHDEKLLKITRLRYAENAFDKGPIVLTTSFFSASFYALFQEMDLEQTPLYQALKSRGYRRAAFSKRLSAQALCDRDCHLLGVPAGELAICITSVTLDSRERELEYTVSLYPQSKNEFELRAHA